MCLLYLCYPIYLFHAFLFWFLTPIIFITLSIVISSVISIVLLMTEEEKLDELLKYFNKMVSDHDPNLSKLDEICKRIFDADHHHSVYRIYRKRLITDGMIYQDTDEQSNKRWMASHIGITHSYKLQKENETILLHEKKDRLKRMERNEVLLAIGTFLFALVEILIHRKDLLSLFCYCY